MNKKRIIITTILVILIVVLSLWISGIIPKQIYREKYEQDNNMRATLKAVVVKVNDNNFLAMGIENGTGLYSIGLDNMELKKGQEILIYFNGDVMETYPAQLGDVGKIEIVKDKSDTPIPDDILRFCYSSKDNVTITISELSNSGITLNIKDTNELPYNYSHSYVINKKVENENYTGVGEQIGENTNNSTAGYTRNRNRIYLERSRKNFWYFKWKYRRNFSI